MRSTTTAPRLPSNLPRAASRFRALGEPTRLRLLDILAEGESSVGELAAATGESQPNASRHLSALAAEGFIASRRESGRTLYRIVDSTLPEICAVVCRALAAQFAPPPRRPATTSPLRRRETR